MTARSTAKGPGKTRKALPGEEAKATGEPLPASLVRITDEIAIGAREIEERFLRASGPGGQNVNKVATAVQLRFDVQHSPSLPAAVRARLERLAGKRLSKEGVLTIAAQRHRTQAQNRREALARLIELIARAAVPPLPRKPTKPSAGGRRRRLADKARRSALKRLRASRTDE
ncbi:MAG TPA: alternative ribosome rescue aminoacyl-tRNA hydrolase ArfB [Alphaproteobacteria bacterium]|nr:alternative ribosome rescue aminoacyl-tRNA hydrolase ArfB [Alphaproteobacteria bacterium]